MLDCRLDLVARVLGAPVPADGAGAVRQVRVDSRSIEPGDLFVALRGERADGHSFVAHALERGAAGALVATAWNPNVPPARLVTVADPLTALGELAAWHRSRFRPHVVAVTGSVGKTTTKDLVAAVLAQQWETLRSPASWNAEVGLPLTLLQLTEEHQAVVVEMAMRGPGQIRYLAGIARPETAVITNIGLSHLELLGSQEAICAAKAEVLDYLPRSGTAVLNADDAFYPKLRSRVPPGTRVQPYSMSGGGSDCVVGTYLHQGPPLEGRGGVEVLGSRFAVRLPGEQAVRRGWVPLLGRHNVANAVAAAAVGVSLGISPQRILRGLAHAVTSAQRMTVRMLPGGAMVLDDSYNASTPEAMLAALEVLQETAAERRIATLGTMLELGPASEAAHRRVGQGVAALRPDLLVGVGEGGSRIAATAVQAGLAPGTVAKCPGNDEALALLREALRPGDVVLVKGSRGLAMESIVEGLAAGKGHAG
jgi:UDP-N-acetylmuramoyl-tripeptide--D-alanyl-D-alanine ligase